MKNSIDFQKIFQQANSAICIATHDGKIISSNESWKEKFQENIPDLFSLLRLDKDDLIHIRPLEDYKIVVIRKTQLSSPDDIAQQIMSFEHDQLINAINVSAIIATTDHYGNILSANDKFIEISGYERDELIGQNHRILNSGLHPKNFFEEMWKTILSGNNWSGEIRNKRKDGTFYWVFTTISPLRNINNEIDRFISIRFDITHEKELDSFEQHNTKLLAIGEISSSIVHELSNPLTILTLKSKKFSLEAKQKLPDLVQLETFLEENNACLHKMTSIITGLRSLAGYQEKDPYQLKNVTSIIDQVIEFNKSKIELSSIKTDVKVDSTQILCNPIQIYQILTNLLQNAIYAANLTPEKWIKFISTEDKDYLYLSVVDSGIGLPTEIEKNLMKPFFTTKPKDKGTGIGLNLSRKLALEHKGNLYYELQNGHTAFTLKLPLPQ